MNWLIFADGSERETDAVGHRVIIPKRIERATSQYWEISNAIFEYVDHNGPSLTYKESYWEIPRPISYRCKGGYQTIREPGVYYYPD